MASPSRISVVQLAPGTSATPGAQAITVPSDAIGVVVCWGEYGAFSTGMTGLTSTFATFSGGNKDQTPSTGGTRNGAGGWWADVTATGSQTLTPVWGSSIVQGPLLTVIFYKDIAAGSWVRDMVSADSSATFPLSINSATDDEVIFFDTQDTSVPSTNSGCTSVDSRTENSSGGRLQTVNSPGSGTTSIPTTSANPATFAISIIGAASAPTITTQPVNQRLSVGDVASFSVAATGTGSLTYQWQDNTSGSFADITGETSTTYTTGTLGVGEAYEVRCVVTDTQGSTNSASAQVWTPSVESRPWGGLYARGAGRDMLRLATRIPNSETNILIGMDALYGPAATGTVNYTLTCDVGNYALTGVAATTQRGIRLVADVGAYAITGQDATLKRGYSLVCSTGSYSLTGHDATLILVAGPTNYTLTCDTGTYSLTGHDATLIYSAGSANYTLSCDVGAYSLTGIDATLTYTPGTANYTLTCDTGSYALTGQNAVTSLGRRMLADVGAYTLTGIAATTSRGFRLTADTGLYALTGVDADLIYTTTAPVDYTLTCETGAYSLSGQDATLRYSGEVTRRRHAGTRKNYIIKGQKYALTDYELALLIQQMLDEVKRPEVQVVTAKEVRQVSRKVWKRLKETLSSLEALTLDKVQEVVESNVIEYDDEDDEEILMLL
jgi:hypothetical protein